MSGYWEEYRRKLISAEEAAGLIKSGMWVDYGAICGFPSLVDEKLAERAGELSEVKIRAEHSLLVSLELTQVSSISFTSRGFWAK